MQSQSASQFQLVEPSELTYQHSDTARDEVFDADGNPKPHWDKLLGSLKTMGPRAFNDRITKARRILRDDGATYNIYSNKASPSHTWGLDLVPSLISSEEWAQIEAGLLERAELFNLMLRDLYGPRDLIRQRVIPPEALFCHQGFLRACQGIQVPGEHELILHAVDLMRGEDGEMCVLTDRTQSPSGAGYALENRTVMSRVLPSLFRNSQVHRLASFFQQMRAKLTSLSPNQDQPRVVVLTPGAHNETYFEHAYFANYLGFHLVQSGDLVVRNGYVWMKALDGLSRVDVILRRVDDLFCDPVELRSDSQLGVANLLEVARAGRVVIANPLGSGLLENPIFLKYLPEISKELLGRELRLKSVENWWCGDPKDLQYVLAHLDSLVIKPIFRAPGRTSVYGGTLTKEELGELRQRILQRPMQYVAQPSLEAGLLPSYCHQQLAPRPSILRSFAVAGSGSYTVMPGGLTRVGVEESSFVISNQVGSQSKDTWIISSEPMDPAYQTDISDAAAPTRDADLISLPSRVVENLFWMGRYAERAEASLRLLRTVFMMLNGEEPISRACQRQLLETVTSVTATRPGFLNASEELIANPDEQLLRVVEDADLSGSVRSNLNAMLYCADESKELLSSDTLRVINDVRDALSELEASLSGGLAAAPEEALDPLVTALMALSGLAHESMVRDFGWRFMDIGRRLERSLQTTNIINNLVVPEAAPADQHILLESLLLSVEGLISYRRRYRARIGVQSTLDLVMMDTTNPRSLLHQLERLHQHIDKLPRAPEARHELSPEERTILQAETQVKLSLLTELNAREDGQRTQLQQTLANVSQALGGLSELISDKYFNHRETSRQLVSNSNWENN
ncbi:circularly permuted type 2 ATP-grasp protein [Pseudomaricurvus alkylphenolicus]|uniref:circularly permuted type 2 ATP-grasp protein n=1 Tax=Pseudomaricurvus alkylphenolicus TaxID=1306991 RepID=UPI0014204040|nr:circularly permuted type 2 ATP-grasp protein [Pseudomaricurvus alkylphenolicus]NIB43083.1 circularly permuted type 2 ATP-grasp protein [Pseudomaricurvus alkylphenolicus]